MYDKEIALDSLRKIHSAVSVILERIIADLKD